MPKLVKKDDKRQNKQEGNNIGQKATSDHHRDFGDGHYRSLNSETKRSERKRHLQVRDQYGEDAARTILISRKMLKNQRDRA
jgi:hypothetical protein